MQGVPAPFSTALQPASPWRLFLETHPPSPAARCVSEICTAQNADSSFVSRPLLHLYCGTPACDGERVYESDTCPAITPAWEFIELDYTCRNCGTAEKRFFLLACLYSRGGTEGAAIKIAEWPPFGPPLPSGVFSLVGLDKDLFLQGRRAETYGYGLGAFAYYRRVVENQKARLIEEMKKAAERLGASTELLESLTQAMRETNFSRGIEIIKPGMPPQLLIEGQNPLVLLHSATSSGLHNETDEECITTARAIRIVLTEMAERIENVMKDQSELERAVRQLRERRRSMSKKEENKKNVSLMRKRSEEGSNAG